jgi:hypothetical protein
VFTLTTQGASFWGMDTPARVVIYTRFSGDIDGNEAAVERQLRVCRPLFIVGKWVTVADHLGAAFGGIIRGAAMREGRTQGAPTTPDPHARWSASSWARGRPATRAPSM